MIGTRLLNAYEIFEVTERGSLMNLDGGQCPSVAYTVKITNIYNMLRGPVPQKKPFFYKDKLVYEFV